MFISSISDKISYHYMIDDNPEYLFQDTLIFDILEYDALNKEEFQNQLQQKYNDWIIYVTTPKNPTKEELEAELAQVLRDKLELEIKEVELKNKIKDK